MLAATRRASRRSRISQAVGRVPLLDRLEARFLLAAHPVVWQINGTPQDDTIEIAVSATNANRATFTLNGKLVESRAFRNISAIRISAGAGNDTVTIGFGVDQANIPATILGGTGNDSITAVFNRGYSAEELAQAGPQIIIIHCMLLDCIANNRITGVSDDLKLIAARTRNESIRQRTTICLANLAISATQASH